VKILLVEDARSVVMVMTSRLTSYGYEVVHAENGKIAVQMFQESCPDLVLMDIEMPVMNGFESANMIRSVEATQQWAWTPIIFLTSSDTVHNLVTAIDAGGDDFMSKFAPEPVLRAKMHAMSRIANLRRSLAAANKKLQGLADLDGLTGLCNRRSMDTQSDKGWADCIKAGKPFGLQMIDIDNFKKYNDHYGHQTGDDCLRSVAQAIDTCVKEANAQGLITDAFAARYGGEEFSVVLPAVSQSAFETVSAALVDAVRQLKIAHVNNDVWGIVTISVGGSRLEVAGDKLGALFRDADARLYRAKDGGRNQAVIQD
jgi:diguanylate cyclase (GGDEF)-like protein